MTPSNPCPGPLDLASDAVRADPYPYYRWYREHDPIHRLEPAAPDSPARHLVLRWKDAEAGLKDLRLKRGVHRGALWNRPPEEIDAAFASYAAILRAWPLFMDPPQHARSRRPVNRVLDQAMSETAMPLLVEAVEERLAALPESGGFDAVADFASLVPVDLGRRLFGLEFIPAARLAGLLQAIGLAIGNVFDPGRIAAASRALDEIGDAIDRASAACRGNPESAPMLRRLLDLSGPGGMISPEQVKPLAALLLQAAQDSVIGVLANGLLVFLRHPDALRHCREQEEGFASAVDEVLRFESLVQQVTRHAAETLELGGVSIRAGEGVSFLLGAANRDPAVFLDPDRFDPRRQPPRTAAFGFGAHACPGADLGRLVAARAWLGFFGRFPNPRYEEQDIAWRPAVTFRTLARLPVLAAS